MAVEFRIKLYSLINIGISGDTDFSLPLQYHEKYPRGVLMKVFLT
jgi:hypothetical protein